MGASIIAVSSETPEEGMELSERLGLTLTLACDTDFAVMEAYGVRHAGEDFAVPAVFVMDRGGTIRYRYIGESMIDRPNSEELLNIVGAYASPRPIAPSAP